jgi:hypothetical protein
MSTARVYRAYVATLLGTYFDIRGQQAIRPDVYASDRYDASQKLREDVRAAGGADLLYDSLRRRTGVNVVAHRRRNITEIIQTDHYEITVSATSRRSGGAKNVGGRSRYLIVIAVQTIAFPRMPTEFTRSPAISRSMAR